MLRSVLRRFGKGFSLIELMVVISIMALLTTIGVATLRDSKTKAERGKAKANVDAIVKLYEGTYNPASGKYRPLTPRDFQSGLAPEAAQFEGLLTDLSRSYKICAKIDPTFAPSCLSNDPDVPTKCYCRTNSQGLLPTPTTTPIPTNTPTPTLTPTNTPTPTPTPTPFMPSWAYKQGITISNNTSVNLTDYQVKVTTPFVSGRMNTDFSDIRFVNSSENAQLPHWRGSYSASSATFWVKIPSLPTTGSSMYMYYGNLSATTATNGLATFPMYFDFNDNVVPPGWVASAGILSASLGSLVWNTTGYPQAAYYNNFSMSRNQWVDARVNVGSNYVGLGYMIQDGSNYFLRRGTGGQLWKMLGGVYSQLGSGTETPTGWGAYSGWFNGDIVYGSINGVTTQGTDPQFSTGFVGASTLDFNATTIQIDWILVRQFKNPEPTASFSPTVITR